MSYRVERGAIVDEAGAILYEADCIRDLSSAARRRLAKLHSADPNLCWEGSREEGRKGAWGLLIEAGLMLAPAKESAS